MSLLRASLVLALAFAPMAQPPQAAPTPTPRPFAAGCDTGGVDWNRLGDGAWEPIDTSRIAAMHGEVWRRARYAAPKARPLVRITITFPWYADPAYVDAYARAYPGRGGRWVVETADRVDRGGFKFRTHRLDPIVSRRLDVLLSGRCLYAGPTHVGGRWPTTRSGPNAVVGCDDGSDTVVEVIHSDRRWATAQNCTTHGDVNLLVGLLLQHGTSPRA